MEAQSISNQTNQSSESNETSSFNFKNGLSFTVRWGARTIFCCFVGYYSLGFAYYKGWMALIDQKAIEILLPSVGYAGLGAVMPNVQWYAARGVQILAAFAAGLVWEIIARVSQFFLNAIRSPFTDNISSYTQSISQNFSTFL